MRKYKKYFDIKRKYHKNGKIKSVSNYKKGRLDGLQRLYHENGYLFAEIQYRNGFRHGYANFYNDDGSFSDQNQYQWGKLHGYCYEFSETGFHLEDLFHKGEWIKSRKCNSLWDTYFHIEKLK